MKSKKGDFPKRAKCPICNHEMRKESGGIFCLSHLGSDYHKLYYCFEGDLISSIYFSYEFFPSEIVGIYLDVENKKTRISFYQSVRYEGFQMDLPKLLELDFLKLEDFKNQIRKYFKWLIFI